MNWTWWAFIGAVILVPLIGMALRRREPRRREPVRPLDDWPRTGIVFAAEPIPYGAALSIERDGSQFVARRWMPSIPRTPRASPPAEPASEPVPPPTPIDLLQELQSVIDAVTVELAGMRVTSSNVPDVMHAIQAEWLRRWLPYFVAVVKIGDSEAQIVLGERSKSQVAEEDREAPAAEPAPAEAATPDAWWRT